MIKKKNLTGTARYASINALNGMTQSRRDDLEAVGYVLLYYLRGKLPWQGLHVKNKEDRYHKIMEIKMETSPYELCKGFPKEYEDYVEYSRKLEYEQDPDYNYLKNLFNNFLKDDNDNIYDWDTGNKTMNTVTTSNTSQKGLIIKEEKKENNEENNNIKNDIDNDNDNDMQNELDKEINEFDEYINKPKNDDGIEDNRISNRAKIQSSKFIQTSDTKRIIHADENRISYNNNDENISQKIHEKDTNKKIEDNDYGNIAELTEEGKDEDKCPNISGFIHNKEQLEKKKII